MPGILQYINRFEEGGRDKLATLTALMIQMGLAGAGVLITLQKEHLLKDGEFLGELNVTKELREGGAGLCLLMF